MKNKTNKLLYNIIYLVICLLFILATYQILALIVNNEYSFPKIQYVFDQTIKLFGENTFWKAFFMSLLRTIIGFILSFVLAFSLSIIYEYLTFSKKFIMIIISILRAVPTIAIILNLLFWTNSKIAPIIIACLVTLPQLFASIIEQLENFDKDIIQMCNLYCVPKKKIFFNVYIPYVIPRLALSLCSNFALTLKLIGSSEALCSTINSIGYLMSDAKISYEPARLIALSIICVVSAIILEYSLKFLIKKIWRIK